MSPNVPIVGDPPLGHAKRRAKIREAMRHLDIEALIAIHKKYGALHTLEAMLEDANQAESDARLPELIGQLLIHINQVERERDMWRSRCTELTEIKKPTTKPDDIPF